MNTDVRFIKTDETIRAVFIELLAETGFFKTSVRAITEKANINRSTFYAHFSDKYALLEAIEEDILTQMRELTSSFHMEEIVVAEGGKKTIEINAFEIYVHKIVTYLHGHGKLLTLLLSEKGDPHFLNKLSGAILSVWERKNMSGYLAAPVNYAYAAVMGMMIQLIVEWVKNDFRESEKEFAEMIVIFAGNLLHGMIE